ncbi:uncharacterized protein KY384_005971 [Bacidia gigantensis]|uniref:uncharacterized protein n=1 Tax=Bacidia gigantensis TaxID=2732470 RepID=UPI001D042610|nr:uncharacterized protein KY384_005971 [Bacidia gigantensis]KAG8529335.1 hypothetical protein KY384_005971 [Bacidia gigantensis]
MGRLSANPGAKGSSLASPKRLDRKPDIHHVVLGDILFDTWFPSFYPDELVGKELDRLYICQWCFKYSKEQQQYLTHTLFAQNLSLFAKLFLDNKSVFFDVASFDYYALVYQPSQTAPKPSPQIIGFFSKEKMSWDNNNLACILVFPPWQRKGLGKVLMGVSYELSEREGRYGGPEKPLSELGKRGYMQFWEARIARTILGMKGRSSIIVSDVAKEAWVLTEDVIASLNRMGVLGAKRKDGSLAVSKKNVKEWAARTNADLRSPISEDAFMGAWAGEDEDMIE